MGKKGHISGVCGSEERTIAGLKKIVNLRSYTFCTCYELNCVLQKPKLVELFLSYFKTKGLQIVFVIKSTKSIKQLLKESISTILMKYFKRLSTHFKLNC